MATKYSPKIVNDGLILSLDAANNKSYPGSGTTWTDIIGGNNGTLTNGPTFSSQNGGYITFDGTNDYVGSFSSQISDTNSKTILAFIYPTTTSRAGICGIRSGQNGWVFTINRTSPGDLTYFHTTGTTCEVAAGITTNKWWHISVTYSTSTATIVLYKNGVQVGSPITSVSSMVSSAFNGVIGDEESTVTAPFKGNIASVQIYNRSLNAIEVLQNYNATKSRFGL